MITFLKRLAAVAVMMEAEFNRRRRDNHATLIRGSVLDPDNHPSKDR